MHDIRVASWAELNDRLYEGSWNPRLGRHRSPCAYRGVADASFDLTTGLMRLGGDFASLEAHILRAFRKYAQVGAPPHGITSAWHWLALAQHHGLPTRLLDWTYSPFVALHFATDCLDLYDREAAVWCVDLRHVQRHLPAPLKSILDENASDAFSVEMLDAAAPALTDFDSLASRLFAAFFEPPSIDERIVNQYALFSLLSDPRARMDAWLDAHQDAVRRIRIPAALKWEIRDKLDNANITERVLYPGLDGLSRWLARYYLPRGPAPR